MNALIPFKIQFIIWLYHDDESFMIISSDYGVTPVSAFLHARAMYPLWRDLPWMLTHRDLTFPYRLRTIIHYSSVRRSRRTIKTMSVLFLNHNLSK